MPNERYTMSQNDTTDAIRRHLGVALDGFIASLLATITPPQQPALQPVLARRKRHRSAAK
jgi:hypothetical protein